MNFFYPSGELILEGDVVLEGGVRCVVRQIVDVNESDAVQAWANDLEIGHTIIISTPLGGAAGVDASTGVAHDLKLLERAPSRDVLK